MGTYHIWTIGCQMNKADSRHLAEALEQRGLRPAPALEEAGLIVVNTCVVRQSAEDRATGYLASLKRLKRPGRTIAVMGCLVGPDADGLPARFPHVDLFLRPGAFQPLLDQFGPAISQEAASALSPTAFVPVIEGCNHFCTYCIVPYRRGRERSRPVADIVCEVSALVQRGIREVTLLGQNVDAYGRDLPERPDLADLLTELHRLPGLDRLRFLTSHPADMPARLVDTIACLPRACPHFSLPVQSGDDGILRAMRRGYTVADYRKLVERIRGTIPDASLSTDVIVGFPGETDAQFRSTLALLEEVQFHTVHVAVYSTRPGTVAARHLWDDVPLEEKQRRLQEVEAIQEAIAAGINARLQGQVVEVLVEGRRRGKWFGRTRSDRLVFFPGQGDLVGALVQVRVERTGPWSLQGRVVE